MMFSKLEADFRALYPGRRGNLIKYAAACASHPGFLACSIFRAQEKLQLAGFGRFSMALRVLNNGLTGADLLPGCTIGPGLVMHHPNGIVVGHKTVIGSNCTLLQGVTLGETYKSRGDKGEYPLVGDDVTIGAGAKILGGIRLGNGCKVGANSVVLIDVPPRTVAVGQPAYVVK